MWRAWEEHRVVSHRDQRYRTEENRYLLEVTQRAYISQEAISKPEGLEKNWLNLGVQGIEASYSMLIPSLTK